MKLDWRQRLRVAALRPVARWALASSPIRRRLLAQAAEQIARGLDPDLAVMEVLDRTTRDSNVWQRTPQQARRHMATSVAIVDVAHTDRPVTTRELTITGADRPIAARLYVPDGAPTPSPAIVFFHGGGWVTGDLDTHDGLCRKLAAGGQVRVIAVDYRLAPEHRFPAAADDAIAGYRAIVARADEFGCDRARLAVAGDSAGGNLSAVVALATRSDPHPPALQVLLYPSVDSTWSQPSHTALRDGFILNQRALDWYVGHYLGADRSDARLRDPRLSPLFADDVAGAAPAMIVIAGFDPLHDEGRAYGDRLRAAGVAVEVRDLPAQVHGFLLLTALSAAARQITNELCVAIGARLRA
jgi:acetyl esterase